jgi:hypothetical protein
MIGLHKVGSLDPLSRNFVESVMVKDEIALVQEIDALDLMKQRTA